MPRKKASTAEASTVSQKTLSFEEALKQLEVIVSQLESGEAPLDKALSLYEQGIALTRQCQQQLEQAEQRVALLEDNGKKIKRVPFEDGPWDDDLDDEDELDDDEDDEEDNDEDDDELDGDDDDDDEEDDDEDEDDEEDDEDDFQN